MSITTQGVVNVKAVQKSLNQMSRDERIDFIRASGNPKVALQVSVRDADAPDAPPQPSPVAENMLKERIKSFGFRTWSEGSAARPSREKRRLPGAGRGAGEKAFDAPAGVGPDSDQVRADVVDGEMHRSRNRRGDLLQHDAAQRRRQLGERGRSAAGDRQQDRRRILARLFPAARQPERTESHAQRRWHAQSRGRGTAGARADRLARRDRGDAAAAGEAARLRLAAGRRRSDRRSDRGRRVEAAQRQARPGMLQRARHRRRSGLGRVRPALRRRRRAVAPGDQSARRPLRRAAGQAAQNGGEGSGDACASCTI